MTFDLSIAIKAQAGQAMVEMKKLDRLLKDVGNTSEETSHQGQKSAEKLGRANKLAAGQVGNLTAQFNDVGMMLAAGQNPLQLALQQGTQITQVIGPMGASGAVKAFGAAFMQMLNPVSLITIGSIAAGAAMVGWLREAWPEAKNLDDAMDDLAESTDRYVEASKRALKSGSDLVDDFGSKSAEMRAQLQRDAQLERSTAMASLQTSAQQITEVFGGLSRDKLVSQRTGGIMREIEATMFSIREEFGLTTKDAASLTSALEAVNSAKTPAENIDAANLFSDTLFRVFKNAESIPKELADAARAASQFRDASGKILSQDEAENRAAQQRLKTAKDLLAELNNEVALQALAAAHGKKSAEVYNYQLGIERERYRLKVAELPLATQLMETWNKANPTRDPFQERIDSANRYYAQTRQQSDEALGSANEMIAVLHEEQAIQTAIALYGKDSVQATDARWAAEERVLRAQLESQDIAQSVQDDIVAATRSTWDTEAATSNWAAAMSDVRAEIAAIMGDIAQLGGGMVSNAAKFVELEALRAGKSVKRAAQEARDFLRETEIKSRDVGASWFELRILNPMMAANDRTRDLLADELDAEREAARERDRKSRSGGRQSDKEAEAIRDLIQSELDELAVLRTLDPVQKEMLKNRKALAGATDQQRNLVEALITERIREQAQMDALQESYDFWGETTLSTLDDLILSGKDFDDVMGNLARTLASAALEATILGTGPLASMFGASDSGGLFGSIFGPLFKAEGGLIHGPGGPTEDRVMTFTSPGEYIVRAAQTAKHLPLLEAINSGAADRLPGFASGGLVGHSFAMASAPPLLMMQQAGRDGGGEMSREPARLELHLSGDIEARNVRASKDIAVKVFRDGIEQFSNEGLPHRMKQIANDEKAIG